MAELPIRRDGLLYSLKSSLGKSSTKSDIELAKGLQGQRGRRGADGASGPAGATGPTGASGATGPTGVAGVSGVIDTTYNIDTPSAGGTVTIPDSTYTEIIDPAGTIATLTIVLPAAPINGQIVRIKFTQVVTALTLSPNSGQSIKGAQVAAALGGLIDCQFGGSTWYC